MSTTESLNSGTHGIAHARHKQRIPFAARAFLRALEHLRHGHLVVHTPDGRHLSFGQAGVDGTVAAHLAIADWRACGKILSGGDIGFAEALREGWVDSADLTALLRLAIDNEQAVAKLVHSSGVAGLIHRIRHLLNRNSKAGSKRNIHAHYDLGNEFYRLWLDSTWTYSSALFAGDYAQPLATAQTNKYRRIVDTLGLKPGQRVLEIGCGWGGFAEYAAARGIQVHGITVSQAQLEFAQDRLRRAGLDQLAKLEFCDYRDLAGTYDAVVSIEMFEAVGEQYWAGYFDTVAARLAPGGQALIQSITIDDAQFEHYRRGTDFIQQFIFPGGMLPSPTRFRSEADKAGLGTLESFAFGKDYAETLRRWRDAFEQQLGDVRALGFDEAFIRIWRLYLAYCEAGFDSGRTDVMHFHLRKAG